MAIPTVQDSAEALRYLTFDDNGLLSVLYGDHDRNLARIEQQLEVSLTSRGNQIAVAGPEVSAEAAVGVLNQLYGRLKSGLSVGLADVDAALRMANEPLPDGWTVDGMTLVTCKYASGKDEAAAQLRELVEHVLVEHVGLLLLLVRLAEQLLRRINVPRAARRLPAGGARQLRVVGF